MKTKLGILFILMTVGSFFLYRMGEKKTVNTEETLIEGVVIDAASQEPIKNVSVAVAGTNPRSVSDEDGKFMVFGYISDEYIFKHPDYKSIIVPGKDIKLVKMEPRAKNTKSE